MAKYKITKTKGCQSPPRTPLPTPMFSVVFCCCTQKVWSSMCVWPN